MPEKFLKSLEKMPKTAGIALGIDRLVMVFTNSLSIDRALAFTHKDL
ncbi:MAG: amino acid--tRNA ligase-related protein [Thermodesulfobacteriota bacterium]|nr:amino acid--tRNA ligase-related protein [Thermodesulfobacteriota bacterium]